MQNEQTKLRNKIKQLRSNDVKKYWKIINGKKKSNVRASLNDLRGHFKSIYNDDIPNLIDNDNINVSNVQSEDSYSELDRLFTTDEVKCAIKNLKNGKAAGTDGIIN